MVHELKGWPIAAEPGALVVIAAVEGKGPIAVALKAAADHSEPLQPIGELLGR